MEFISVQAAVDRRKLARALGEELRSDLLWRRGQRIGPVGPISAGTVMSAANDHSLRLVRVLYMCLLFARLFVGGNIQIINTLKFDRVKSIYLRQSVVVSTINSRSLVPDAMPKAI